MQHKKKRKDKKSNSKQIKILSDKESISKRKKEINQKWKKNDKLNK
jgi:hypothetical protein